MKIVIVCNSKERKGRIKRRRGRRGRRVIVVAIGIAITN
jgi:DNA-binding MarR family transcriptional regulator